MFPASGSKDLAADVTTAVPMNNERVAKLSANNQDIKGTHQNETQVLTSSCLCGKAQQPLGHHLGTYWRCRTPAPSPDILEQNLYFKKVAR